MCIISKKNGEILNNKISSKSSKIVVDVEISIVWKDDFIYLFFQISNNS